MIFNPYIQKRKVKKPNAKTRELRASWDEILDKYDIKPTLNSKKKSKQPVNILRQTEQYPSLDTNIGSTTKKPVLVYTGNNMIGISTLHKSNLVPVFRQQDIIDISKMRRS